MRPYMVLAVLLAAAACSSSSERTFIPGGSNMVSAQPTLADERTANESAYRFLYLPERPRLLQSSRGKWLAIVDRRIVPSNGFRPMPVDTWEEADAAARAAAPDANHRFLFRIGDDGDVEWPVGGSEVRHLAGAGLVSLLERDDVRMSRIGPSEADQSIEYVQDGGPAKALTVTAADSRVYLQPEIGPPDESRSAKDPLCLATGFGGTALLAGDAARGLEMWEVPGIARIVEGSPDGVVCRRALARFRWPGTSLDFTVPVAVWPE